MLQFLFDTDHLTLLQHRQPRLVQQVMSRPADEIGIGAVTAEEALRGRLAALTQARNGPMRILQYRHLLESLTILSQFPRIPYDQASENRFQQLLLLRPRIGTQDLKIAAIALANNVTLLTRNRRDFGRIPGLQIDDWSV